MFLSHTDISIPNITDNRDDTVIKKITLHTLNKMKHEQQKIACLTCYDYSQAALVSANNIDLILVGDSLGMVSQGHQTTVSVTMEQMVYHTQMVKKGSGRSFLVADMPYMSYATEEQTLKNAALLMQAGAEMVKLEGGRWLCDTISKLSERGIPTCVHLGLTPQSVAMLGGFKVQGRDELAAEKLEEDAKLLERAGANLLVLECIPKYLAMQITRTVGIPTIGIGAGADTDGQILVFYDMLNMTQGHLPRFTKNFLEGADSTQKAIFNYAYEVKAGIFPQDEHTYS